MPMGTETSMPIGQIRGDAVGGNADVMGQAMGQKWILPLRQTAIMDILWV